MAKKKVITTPRFRLSFPSLFQPTAFSEDQAKKYRITMLFPKGTDLSKLITLAREELLKEWPKDMEKRPTNLRTPFRKGEEKAHLEGYEAGVIFCNATSLQRPVVVDEDVQQIMDQDAVYAGCWCKASLTAFSYDKAGNRGVAFGLQNVQKVGDDESFTGRSKPEDDFEAEVTSDNIAGGGDDDFDLGDGAGGGETKVTPGPVDEFDDF